MTKLEREMLDNPEMTAADITRVQLRKIADPLTRAGLLALVDLVELWATGGSAEYREAKYFRAPEDRPPET